MFGGSSSHNSILNAMISSNFSQIFSQGGSTLVGPAQPICTTSTLLMAPPSYAEAMLNSNFQRQFQQQMNNSPKKPSSVSLSAIASPDILRLAAETTAVTLRDDDIDGIESTSNSDQPLDLSLKNTQKHRKVRTSFHTRAKLAAAENAKNNNSIISTPSSSSASSSLRASVIQNAPLPETTRNGPISCEVKRSYSSVSHHKNESSEPDVCEHFRRSLSGKWPRRQQNYAHYISPASSASIQQQQQTMRNGTIAGSNGGSVFGTSASSSLHSVASSSVAGSLLDFGESPNTSFRTPSANNTTVHHFPNGQNITSSTAPTSGTQTLNKMPNLSWQFVNPDNSESHNKTTSAFQKFQVTTSTSSNNHNSETIAAPKAQFATTSPINSNNNADTSIKPTSNGNYRIAAKIIINEGRQGKELDYLKNENLVEDHFRKALGDFYKTSKK